VPVEQVAFVSGPVAVRRPSRASGTRRSLVGLAFVAPTAAIVAALFLVPLAILVYMSFTDWPLLGDPTFNGLKNYRQLGSDDQFDKDFQGNFIEQVVILRIDYTDGSVWRRP